MQRYKWGYPLCIYGLRTHGEADEVGADTEASTLASRHTDRRGDNVEDSEHGSGNNAEGEDLLNGESLLGDKDSGDGHEETLDQVLDSTVNDLSGEVHSLYIDCQDFFSRRRGWCVVFKQIDRTLLLE